MSAHLQSLAACVARLEDLGAEPHKTPRGFVARCVVHDDTNPSLSLSTGTKGKPVVAFCFTCGRVPGWWETFAARLDDDTPLPPAPAGSGRKSGGGGYAQGSPVAAYDYADETEAVRFRKTRYEDEAGRKTFAWARPYGSSWASGLGMGVGIADVPLYRLPALLVDGSDGSDKTDGSQERVTPSPVYWVEGEKDADNGAAAGLVTTTSGGGAKGALPHDLTPLAGRDVIVVADNDQPGLAYAVRVRDTLRPIAATVTLALPAVDTDKADLSDHLAAGYGPDDLRVIVEQSLGEVLSDLTTWWMTYVACRDKYGPVLLSLWAAHCHAMDAWYTTPRLLATSALPGSGKTTVLEHLERLTPNALMGSHATPALLARVTRNGPRPILLDETDVLLDRKREGVGDLTAMLNSGYKRGGSRPVLVPVKGGDWVETEMPTYAPVAMAGIGDHLPDATATRTIAVHLDRALPGQVEPSDWQMIETQAWALRDRLALAVSSEIDALTAARPALTVHSRDAELWRPLVALADVAGGEWPDLARAMVEHFMEERALDQEAGLAREKPSQTLLSDLHEVWDGTEPWMPTEALCHRLAAHNPDLWGFRSTTGNVTPRRLAWLLRDYGVRPTRNREQTARGYARAAFVGPWQRYLAITDDGPSTTLSREPSVSSEPSDPSCSRCSGPVTEADLITAQWASQPVVCPGCEAVA